MEIGRPLSDANASTELWRSVRTFSTIVCVVCVMGFLWRFQPDSKSSELSGGASPGAGAGTSWRSLSTPEYSLNPDLRRDTGTHAWILERSHVEPQQYSRRDAQQERLSHLAVECEWVSGSKCFALTYPDSRNGSMPPSFGGK
jgi:hypothetical protein